MYKRVISKILQLSFSPDDEILIRNNVTKIHDSSLIHYYGNVHSQRGQDGIISEILRRLKIKNGFFVEFGAWDGVYLSNTRFLYEKGWHGCLIEGNRQKCKKIARYFDHNYINIINSYVGFSKSPDSKFKNSLSEILNQNKIDPKIIDLLVIDIDGFDLEILKDLTFFPKMIVIEGGFDFSPFYSKSVDLPVQQPLGHIIEASLVKGYLPVCFLQDTYFIRNDLFNRNIFPIDNSVISLYKDAFYFMSAAWRKQLLDKRANSTFIRNLETSEFGKFFINPLDYE